MEQKIFDKSSTWTKQLTSTTEHKRRKTLNASYEHNSQDEETLNRSSNKNIFKKEQNTNQTQWTNTIQHKNRKDWTVATRIILKHRKTLNNLRKSKAQTKHNWLLQQSVKGGRHWTLQTKIILKEEEDPEWLLICKYLKKSRTRTKHNWFPQHQIEIGRYWTLTGNTILKRRNTLNTN